MKRKEEELNEIKQFSEDQTSELTKLKKDLHKVERDSKYALEKSKSVDDIDYENKVDGDTIALFRKFDEGQAGKLVITSGVRWKQAASGFQTFIEIERHAESRSVFASPKRMKSKRVFNAVTTSLKPTIMPICLVPLTKKAVCLLVKNGLK